MNILEVTFSTRFSSNSVKMFVSINTRFLSKLGHVGHKVGHGVKLKENLVNTLAVTFST